MMVEHNSVVLERNGLQLQCTQAVRKWNTTLGERERLEDDLKKVNNICLPSPILTRLTWF